MTLRALFVFAAALMLAVPAVCFLGAVPARGQDSLYTVSGVHVDAGAASTTEAFNAAIAQGRGRAFQILFRRLTRQADWAKQPALDAQALVRLGRGYTVANERRSTTRYVADVTYMFNPDAVARTLRAAQIASASASAVSSTGHAAGGSLARSCGCGRAPSPRERGGSRRRRAVSRACRWAKASLLVRSTATNR